MFRGKAMTYYGRWTYKYEIAAEKGAAAAIIIHETGPAGYPLEVVSAAAGAARTSTCSRAGQQRESRRRRRPGSRVDKAQRAVRGRRARTSTRSRRPRARKDFQPVRARREGELRRRRTRMREVESQERRRQARGLRPDAKDEYVVYTAHWDHLGRTPTLEGDQIFNGALDNASGTAGAARAREGVHEARRTPQRSILFLAVTAEEKGLLGAKYYARIRSIRSTKTLANINIDGVNQWGRTNDIVVIGLGNSTLDDVLDQAAARTGPGSSRPTRAREGFFYRSDHFEFAKQGVPALYPDAGDRLHRQARRLRPAEARRVHRTTTTTSRPTR